ncbi:DEAD/DEAH box helicase [Raoultibacter phocaeensis]|uniref:DEAD/DEAH box helicase n=1 Tax=Raoultibacter phocaeensis TaxID=2479841 RepID=UPI00111AB7E0|nr:DEAD/DEAH box helicase [Raoultibacter phocaeensis]
MSNTQSCPAAFNEMPLTPHVIRAIDEIGYTKPTNIQARAIPFLLEGHDLIGRSCTGSGKTGAFAIPAIESVDGTSHHAQVLVLSPTRELAMQIYCEMRKFSKYKEGVSLAVVYGGAPMGDQIKQLRHANIVIGTPGRLMDHMRRKTLKLDRIQTVVLDEADEMLNMGFIDDIETILTATPEDRQTVLFSATMSASLLKISNTFLTDPVTVETLSGKENQADIEQTYYRVAQAKKKDVLSLLMHANGQRSVVFCNTKSMVDELAETLRKQGFKASGLHGDMTQAARSQVMQGFRKGSVHALIATDVAARGIDVDDVDVVINYDLPQSFEYYVHRIGRTGRAGKRGVSQTLICNGKQHATLRALMKYTGSTIDERTLPTSGEIMDKTVKRTACTVEERAKTPAGNAAQKLVASLLESDSFEGSEKQVAVALAEMLMGGDEQFDRLKDIEAYVQKPKHKAPAKKAHGSAPRKRGGASFEPGNRKAQGKRKPQSRSERRETAKKKKQRSRAYEVA